MEAIADLPLQAFAASSFPARGIAAFAMEFHDAEHGRRRTGIEVPADMPACQIAPLLRRLANVLEDPSDPAWALGTEPLTGKEITARNTTPTSPR